MNQPIAPTHGLRSPNNLAIDPALLDLLLRQKTRATIESLSLHLGDPPNKILKELNRLNAAGCKIETHPQDGLRLRNSGLSSWSDYLKWSCGHPPRMIEVYAQTTSTQDAARRIVNTSGSAGDAAIVIADEQTAGRGRLGRRWVAPAGTGAIFSRVCRVKPSAPSIDRLTFISAVAVAQTIERHAPQATVQIKWPNDIMVGGRKIAGILVETFSTPDTPTQTFAIIGVGINVTLEHFQSMHTACDDRPIGSDLTASGVQTHRGFPCRVRKSARQPDRDEYKSARSLTVAARHGRHGWIEKNTLGTHQPPLEYKDLLQHITSVRAIGGSADRLLVLNDAIQRLDDLLGQHDLQPILDGWKQRCPLLSQQLRLRSDGRIITGQVIDLDPEAGLLVRTNTGVVVHLRAATTTVI